MASLVELQDFAVNLVCGNKPLAEQLVDVQTLGANIEEIWRKFDTPPLSPERDRESEGGSSFTTCSSESGSVTFDDNDSDPDSLPSAEDQQLLDELLACQQFLSTGYAGDEDWLSGDTQNSVTLGVRVPGIQSKLLIQDCMWNSKDYEPRHQLPGVCTPAPSPPPSPPRPADVMEDDERSGVQTDCVVDATVMPILHRREPLTETLTKPPVVERPVRERRGAYATVTNARVPPQTTHSESEEEIDVVTVVERPGSNPTPNPNPRKRPSVSAPSSPIPPSPVKRRKYHHHSAATAKRYRRLDSAGSSLEGAESDDEQKRESHNVLERKRRNDLKYSFQLLRGHVPELEDNQRAPKVTILRKATEFIIRMQEEENRMNIELKLEQERKTKLLERLAFLKSLPAH